MSENLKIHFINNTYWKYEGSILLDTYEAT